MGHAMPCAAQEPPAAAACALPPPGPPPPPRQGPSCILAAPHRRMASPVATTVVRGTLQHPTAGPCSKAGKPSSWHRALPPSSARWCSVSGYVCMLHAESCTIAPCFLLFLHLGLPLFSVVQASPSLCLTPPLSAVASLLLGGGGWRPAASCPLAGGWRHVGAGGPKASRGATDKPRDVCMKIYVNRAVFLFAPPTARFCPCCSVYGDACTEQQLG